MNASEIKQYLTAGEWADYCDALGYDYAKPTVKLYTSLANCRRLLEKLEWIRITETGTYICSICQTKVHSIMFNGYKGNITDLHKHDCAIAAQLKGVGREKV